MRVILSSFFSHRRKMNAHLKYVGHTKCGNSANQKVVLPARIPNRRRRAPSSHRGNRGRDPLSTKHNHSRCFLVLSFYPLNSPTIFCTSFIALPFYRNLDGANLPQPALARERCPRAAGVVAATCRARTPCRSISCVRMCDCRKPRARASVLCSTVALNGNVMNGISCYLPLFCSLLFYPPLGV